MPSPILGLVKKAGGIVDNSRIFQEDSLIAKLHSNFLSLTSHLSTLPAPTVFLKSFH